MTNFQKVEAKPPEEQWYDNLSVDSSLLDSLIQQHQELGPEVLKDSKYDSILAPFEMKWTFGFDVTVPIINLTDEQRHLIFYSAANVGILYDYCKKDMIHLRGHQHKIISTSVDRTGKWLATADTGIDNVILVWDTYTSAIVWTIFDYPGSNSDLIRIALSPSAKLMITLTNENSHTVGFWLWTYGKEKPDDTYTDESDLGTPKAIEFHPNKEEHIMIVYERFVLFFHWDYETSKASKPTVVKKPFIKGIGHYTDGTYVEQCHESFVSTSKGNVLVFGNTIYARNYENNKELDNTKIYVKCIKISKGNVTCITSIDQIIVTGDSNGAIMFFDRRLKLLYWLAKRLNKPICTISFKLCPRKYKLDPSLVIHDDQDSMTIPDCQDRSEEYEILMAKTIPQDASLQRRPFVTRDHFISTLDGSICIMHLPQQRLIPLFSCADGHVAAIDVHDEKPYLIIAYSKGRIVVFNYETHEEVISTVLPDTEDDSSITTIKYSTQCLHLACGRANGELWLLQPSWLSQIYVEPFRFSTRKVLKIVFSTNSLQMAYYDDNMTIYGFYYDTEAEDWVFKGKVRSHYKEICNMLFLDEPPYGLYSIGRDRHLIKYTDLVAEEAEIDISVRDRIEQKDIPVYFLSYPKRKFSKSGYFLVVDDKHKYKVISNKTNMCTAVYLGPAYGCFQNNPVCKIEFIPKHDKNYLVFMTKKQIGIQLMPIDGNPYKFVGCLGHPDELADFQISHDGRFVFTIGKHDRTVFKWKIKLTSVETMHQLGGAEMQPFFCLIEGGRGGFLYQEMRDLFYYMQILQQGEQVCSSRVVSRSINIGELPDLMRACGYYPSEYEIENLLTDMRYKEFDDTGLLKDKVTFCEFIKLFINHKPAYGYPVEKLEECFGVVTTFTDEYGGSSMAREDFIEAATTTGEQLSVEQIFKCLATLMHEDPTLEVRGERDFSFLPSTIDFDFLAEDILGIDMNSIERLKVDEDELGSYGYGYGYGYGYDRHNS